MPVSDPRPPVHPNCPFSRDEWESKLRDLNTSIIERQSYNQWILGTVISVLLVIMGLVWSGLVERIQVIENNGSPPMRERMSRSEGEMQSLRRDMQELKEGQREILTLLREHDMVTAKKAGQ